MAKLRQVKDAIVPCLHYAAAIRSPTASEEATEGGGSHDADVEATLLLDILRLLTKVWTSREG